MGDFLLAIKRTNAMWMVNLFGLTTTMSIGCMLLRLMIVFKNWVMKVVVGLSFTGVCMVRSQVTGVLFHFLMSLEILQDHDPD
jgi:hypothetical protein